VGGLFPWDRVEVELDAREVVERVLAALGEELLDPSCAVARAD
jgi:hypothetical protein